MSAYTIVTTYWDKPSIEDEFDTLEEALEAWDDANWEAVHAPKAVVGDIRSLTLRARGQTVRTVRYGLGVC